MNILNIRETEFTEFPVRAIIAVIITLGLIIGFFLGLIQPIDFKEISLLVLTFYFAKRSVSDEQPSNSNPPPKIKDPPRLSENPAE